MERAQGVTLPSWLVILSGLAILLGIVATVGIVVSGPFSGTASAAAPLYAGAFYAPVTRPPLRG